MRKLSKREIKKIEELLKEGRPLPEDYKNTLFPESKKEYELIYLGKDREEDILAETMRVPLQPVKTFCNGQKTRNGWTNRLIFGDNLQVLKELMYDPEVKGKVRLVYIDPPFATKQEFRGSQDQKAYQDKIAGAKFLEFLRKRLIFLREILADDGSIYVHLDYRKMHYVKALMDEIFGEQNFRNCITWKREVARGMKKYAQFFGQNSEYFLLYTRSGDTIWNIQEGEEFISEKEANLYYLHDKDGYFTTSHRGTYSDKSIIELNKQNRVFVTQDGKLIIKNGKVTTTKGTIRIKYYLERKNNGYAKRFTVDNVWTDIRGIAEVSIEERMNFPTQKPEALLERIIKASSNEGDIVLDCFAGSGTTGAVAEKLGRRWIIIDSSKLAIYTIQKRLLNLRKEVGNKEEKLIPKPFTLYNAGLYDYQKIKEFPWEQYRDFSLKLFQCRDEQHTISGIDLDGYLGPYDVLVFNYKKYKDITLDYGFIDDLHSVLGDKISKWFFIITPAANVQFLEDYVEREGIKYFILRIPYSIISEIHEKGFTAIKQPADERAVNDIMEAVGFDFIQIPKVRCRYYLAKSKGVGPLGLDRGKAEAVIKIKIFESETLSKEARNLKNLESLSMIMLDYDYNGKVFDLDDVFYAEGLKKQDYEIRFDPNKIKGQMMIIYCDIFGNEKREIKTLKDFKR